jgi:hypothetical protein
MRSETCVCSCALVRGSGQAADGDAFRCSCRERRCGSDEEELAQLEALGQAVDARIGQLRPVITRR